jgi:DNA-binding transcriptional LysR family regulator
MILRAVALRGGVSDAAQLLHLTASAVSQQLTLLERETGMALFDRSQRRIGLTAAGQLLAARAGRIERELNEARRELTALSGRVSGPAVIAAFSSVIRQLLVPAMAILARTHPELQPGVLELEGPAALRELRTGAVDLVIAEGDDGPAGPRHPGLTARPLADDAYRVVVPSSWAPVARTMADLSARPWITGPPESVSAQALERLAASHRFHPDRRHCCIEYPSVLSLVAAGQGAAIVPALALGEAYAGTVLVTAIPTARSRRLTVLHRASDQGPGPLERALIAALDQAVQARGRVTEAATQPGPATP